MRFRLLRHLTILSALTCSAVAVLWVRSVAQRDFGATRVRDQLLGAASLHGRLMLVRASLAEHVDADAERDCRAVVAYVAHDYGKLYDERCRLHCAGFGIEEWPDGGGDGFREPRRVAMQIIVVPCWSLVTLFAIPPIIWCCGVTRRKLRSLSGLCVHCGYDLRASRERCPECGTPFASVAPSPK